MTFTEIINHLKSKGFVFAGSEIYGGLANSWDYGPLGVLIKNNLKNLWWAKMVTKNQSIFGLDSSIILNKTVWKASGHLENFNDPLIDCKVCKKRYRADHLISAFNAEINPETWTESQLESFITVNKIPCPNCLNCNFTEIRRFQLMFKTYQGVLENEKNELFLRPETAQGIFINYKNFITTVNAKIPFGIAQIGKSFRNEITPGNFIFRTREFEQMELEFFYDPVATLETDNPDYWFSFWLKECHDFLLSIGLTSQNLKIKPYEVAELAHYSKRTSDILFKFPFGWEELMGVADRGDFDLKNHQKYSGVNLEYFDRKNNRKFLPNVIEPSFGVERLILALFCNGLKTENLENGNERILFDINPILSPYKLAVVPLHKKKLHTSSMNIYNKLNNHFTFNIKFEEKNIGEAYRYHDSIGTPFIITVDYDSETDQCVTVRERNTMTQERIKIEKLIEYISNAFNFSVLSL